MLGLFDVVKERLKVKFDAPTIDNWAFKMHYRLTTVVFVIATILVTSREYIGESISCINDMNDPGFTKVVETFCFFTSTFTVLDSEEVDRVATYDFAHRGVGPLGAQHTIRRHYYYQWVPFVLFGQAIMFYLTHVLWKKFEDGRIAKMIVGLHSSAFTINEEKVSADDQAIPTKRHKRQAKIQRVKKHFLERVSLHSSWCVGFVACEVLNVLHVVFQVFVTDRFLGRQFRFLGLNVAKGGAIVLDDVFPKVTKCVFHKYGSSGSIQMHDALCVLALNVINEKIYVFLWFWFAILLAASCLILAWRLLTFLLYSRCSLFNQIIFGSASQGRLHAWQVDIITKNRTYADWLFLKYLSKNMDGLAFRQLMVNLSEDLEDKKPLYVFVDKDRLGNVNKFE